MVFIESLSLTSEFVPLVISLVSTCHGELEHLKAHHPYGVFDLIIGTLQVFEEQKSKGSSPVELLLLSVSFSCLPQLLLSKEGPAAPCTHRHTEAHRHTVHTQALTHLLSSKLATELLSRKYTSKVLPNHFSTKKRHQCPIGIAYVSLPPPNI